MKKNINLYFYKSKGKFIANQKINGKVVIWDRKNISNPEGNEFVQLKELNKCFIASRVVLNIVGVPKVISKRRTTSETILKYLGIESIAYEVKEVVWDIYIDDTLHKENYSADTYWHEGHSFKLSHDFNLKERRVLEREVILNAIKESTHSKMRKIVDKTEWKEFDIYSYTIGNVLVAVADGKVWIKDIVTQYEAPPQHCFTYVKYKHKVKPYIYLEGFKSSEVISLIKTYLKKSIEEFCALADLIYFLAPGWDKQGNKKAAPKNTIYKENFSIRDVEEYNKKEGGIIREKLLITPNGLYRVKVHLYNYSVSGFVPGRRVSSPNYYNDGNSVSYDSRGNDFYTNTHSVEKIIECEEI